MAAYVSTAYMIDLYEEGELIKATNLGRQDATAIYMPKLIAACNGATGIANGYLMRQYVLPIPSMSEELAAALEAHCGAIARCLLDCTLEETQKANAAAIEWLTLFTNEAAYVVDDVAVGTTDGGIELAKTISSEPGRQVWGTGRGDFSALGW